MLVQFGNNWIKKIPLTAKLDSAYGLIQFWLSSEFFSSNYFQIGQACSRLTYTNSLNGNLNGSRKNSMHGSTDLH